MKVIAEILSTVEALFDKGKKILAGELLEVIGEDSPLDDIQKRIDEISRDADKIRKRIKILKEVFAAGPTAELVTGVSKGDIEKLDKQYHLLDGISNKIRNLKNIRLELSILGDSERRKRMDKEAEEELKTLEEDEGEAYWLLWEIGKKHVPRALLSFGKKIFNYLKDNLDPSQSKSAISTEFFPGVVKGPELRFAYYIEFDKVKDYDGDTVNNIFIYIYTTLDTKTGNLGQFGVGADLKFVIPDKLLGIPTNDVKVAIRVIQSDLEGLKIPLLKTEIQKFDAKKLGPWKKRAVRKGNRIYFIFNSKDKDDFPYLSPDKSAVNGQTLQELFIGVLKAADLGKPSRNLPSIVNPDKKTGGGERLRYRIYQSGNKRVIEFIILAF